MSGLVEVLAAHDWRWAIRDSRTGDGVRIACTAPDCDWHAERLSPDDDVWDAHRTHVADAILAHLRAVAADEGVRERCGDAVAGLTSTERVDDERAEVVADAALAAFVDHLDARPSDPGSGA